MTADPCRPTTRPSGRLHGRRATPPRRPRSRSCSTGSPRRYDLMNLLISAFQEPRWRRRLVARARPPSRAAPRSTSRPGPARWPPTCTRASSPSGGCSGVDLSPGMTAVARQRYAGRPGLDVRGGRRARPPDRGRDVRRRHHRLRHAQPARLPARVRGDGALRPARRPGPVPGDRAARGPALARFMRWWFDRIVPGHRPARRPGRRVRLPRPERPGLPVARSGSRRSWARPVWST